MNYICFSSSTFFYSKYYQVGPADITISQTIYTLLKEEQKIEQSKQENLFIIRIINKKQEDQIATLDIQNQYQKKFIIFAFLNPEKTKLSFRIDKEEMIDDIIMTPGVYSIDLLNKSDIILTVEGLETLSNFEINDCYLSHITHGLHQGTTEFISQKVETKNIINIQICKKSRNIFGKKYLFRYKDGKIIIYKNFYIVPIFSGLVLFFTLEIVGIKLYKKYKKNKESNKNNNTQSV